MADSGGMHAEPRTVLHRNGQRTETYAQVLDFRNVSQDDKKNTKTNKRNPKKGSKCKAEEVDDMEELDPTKQYANCIYDSWPAAKKAHLHKLRSEHEGCQVSAVSFAPAPEALEKAQKLIAAYEKAKQQNLSWTNSRGL